MKKEIYLFDFDGTLVDSMPTFLYAVKSALFDFGVETREDLLEIATPRGYTGTVRYYNSLGYNLDEETLVSRMYSYAFDEYKTRVPLKAGTKETLEALKARGASLNILTGSPHKMLDVSLERLGIAKLFDNALSCEDFNTTKADPKLYRMVADKIGADFSDVIFIDDNIAPIKVAKAEGMTVFGIYDPSSEEYKDEIRAVADRYIDSVTELLKG